MKIEYAVLFAIETLKFRITWNIFYEAEAKRIRLWFIVLTFAAYIGILYNLQIDYLEKRLVLYSIIILNQYVVLKESIREKNIKIWIITLGLSCMDEIYTGILSCIIFSIPNFDIVTEHMTIISSSLTLLTCVLLNKMKSYESNIRKVEKGRIFLENKIKVVVVIFAMIILFSIACLSYAKECSTNKSFIICANTVCVLSFFSLLLLVMFLMFFKNSNETLQQHIAEERRLIILQKNYYETLLEKEKDTRKFRHDINNHLLCLQVLANKTQDSCVIEYIDDMQQKLLKIQKRNYVTGNDIIDTFLNHESQKRKNNVEIRIVGACNNDLPVSDMDMCIIFSNLLANAFEELDRIQIEDSPQRLRKLFINLNQNEKCFKCQIKNTIRSGYNKRGEGKSEKLDQKKHGFGLENVKETIQRNRGMLQVTIENGWYICSIVLNLK